MLLVVTCLMMVCSVGLAAADHKDLAKQQQAVESMLDVFNGEPVPSYAQVSTGFSANMKKAVTEKAFAELQKSTYKIWHYEGSKDVFLPTF